MVKSYEVFDKLVKENNGEMPTLEQFLELGYSKTSYFRCKKAYKLTDPEEAGYAKRTNVEVYDNGIRIVTLKFF